MKNNIIIYENKDGEVELRADIEKDTIWATQEQIAKRVGKDRSTVANLMRLLSLPQSVQEMLGTGAISMGHARALLPLEDSRRQETLAQPLSASQALIL